VVYFGASGDTAGKTIYPSASPDVVAAGGTTINRDPSGNFTSETGWGEDTLYPYGSGGGPSPYEPEPLYQQLYLQSSIGGISTTGQRNVPDFSFDADPATGVSVYDSTSCNGLSGWLVFGGTSVASPSLSGIVNLGGHVATTTETSDELTTIYTVYDLGAGLSYPSDFNDITLCTSGETCVYPVLTGWDFVTGIGSNKGTSGK
jgi:subtilase family serine protease